MRAKVYVSGPLTSSGDPEQNMNDAAAIGRRLIELGYAAMVPHLTWHLDPNAEIAHEVWMAADLPWLVCADAVLRLPGHSKGADIECKLAQEIGIPIVPVARGAHESDWEDALAATIPTEWHPSTDAFAIRARKLVLLHQAKAADYGSADDPLANLRASGSIGVAPWRSAWLRACDKIFRLNAYFTRGRLRNEGVKDTLHDLASYCLLADILHDAETCAPESL